MWFAFLCAWGNTETLGHRRRGRPDAGRALVGAGYTVSGSVTPAPSSAAASTRMVGAGDGAPVASVGCDRPPGQSVSNELQGVVVGSTPRWYLLTAPAPTTPGPSIEGTPSGGIAPRPLVLDFHGVGENAFAQADTSRFGALGQLDGFVVVTPSGTGNPVHLDTTDPPATNPDLQFVAALVDQVESTQCIDTSRVYATGFSDGAIMASQLACTMSDRIAAVSTVSGLAMPPLCNLIRPVPVIAFHGTADPSSTSTAGRTPPN